MRFEAPPRSQLRRPRKWLAGAFVLCLLPVAISCNYQFVRYREDGRPAQRLYLRTLENDTSEARVELLFSEALRREILRRGALRFVSDERSADYRLSGRIANVETSGRSFSSTVLALEYTVQMVVDLSVVRRDGTVVPLDPRALRSSEVYLTSADVEAGRKNRQESLRRVSDVLALRIADALDELVLQ